MLRLYTFLLSLFLLAEGIWGLYSNVIFGNLTTNVAHATVHLVLGLIGFFVVMGFVSGMRSYNGWVGVLLLLSGALYFVPGIDYYLVRWFNMNSAVAVLNLVLGVLSLLMASARQRIVVAH